MGFISALSFDFAAIVIYGGRLGSNHSLIMFCVEIDMNIDHLFSPDFWNLR